MPYLTDDPAGGVLLAAPGTTTYVAVAATETPALHRAVRDLAQDLASVCGAVTQIGADAGPARIVVGTAEGSDLVRDAVGRGVLDLLGLHDDDGHLHWEGYVLQEAEGRLWIVGADVRGAIFGVYDLCEQAGVSPWSWWADVPVRRRPHVTVRPGTSVADHPSVRFRGIFLNDEEELDAWARRHTPDDTIGPHTYERVCELLLRLKGNYLWPAMHVNAFNADPANGRLAHDMGVVIGTSHCDMLLRSNQHEWAPWLAERGGPHLEYDYSIPGANRDALHDYWRDSIIQNRDHEVTWTLGMRGIHDSGFHTSAIDEDDTLTAEQKHRARVDLLGRVIADQRGLLADELGAERARRAPQVFVPYKEVLPLYADGLDLPEDITLVWSDDSYGHVRRFPDEQELRRPGGHGLYYHSSYWSPPSRSYLWVSSTPPAQMRNELRKAWDRGIRTLWVDNVGPLKPLEQDVEMFLRLAWEAGRETTTADPSAYLAAWVDRTFSGGHGARVAEILQDFAQLNDVRKVEQLASRVFSQTAYGDEAARRLARLRRSYDDVNDVMAALPHEERDAFMQLVALKVHAAYLTNAQFCFADRSILAHEQGKLAAADHWLAVSRRFDAFRRALVAHYNTVMADGRWESIMTPDDFPPPATAQYPPARPALGIGRPGLGVVTWDSPSPGERPRLTFSAHGTRTKWIEVFSTGAGPVDFTITADSWIEVAEASGSVRTERRVRVHVPATGATAGRRGQVVVHCATDGRTVVVDVTVEDACPLDGHTPSDGVASPGGHARSDGVAPSDAVVSPEPRRDLHLEADGYVSVPATATSARVDADHLRWVEVDRLGRGEGALVEARRTSEAGSTPGEGRGATSEYDLHLHTAGAHLLELHRVPTLNATGRFRLAVALDDAPPVVLESAITDEYRGTWTRAVVEGVERLSVRLPWAEPGTRRLRVEALDEDVALTRLVLYTAEPRRTALGPPSSASSRTPRAEHHDPAPDTHDLAAPERVCREVYRIDPDALPLPDVVHVPRTYWDGDTLFGVNPTTPQRRPGAVRHAVRPDGTKDVPADMPAGRVEARDGVLAVDVERALLGTGDGWLTPSGDEPGVGWTHTQAETGGGTGLALHVDAPGRRWDDPLTAPGLHVAVRAATSGTYRVWALVKFDGTDDDSCHLALDGTPQPLSAQFSGGDMFTFGTAQAWIWTELTDLPVTAGDHVVSVLARKAGLRVARLYLTLGEELPPVDEDWPC
ncbi:glycosyl hydrolase 115 family protein [Isoptericola jiangsuensis]|uniref:glycosyl hydrolase 115 family protein n=1 Tax=Isoptericola jiangsuensis TaxID=548579 RepID=UPI003AAAA68B